MVLLPQPRLSSSKIQPADFNLSERSAWVRYLFAFGCVLLAFAAHYALIQFVGYPSRFTVFLPAVMAASWYGGLGPGIAAAVGGALSGYFLFIPEAYDSSFGMSDAARLSIYTVTVSLTIALVIYARRRWYAMRLLEEFRESEERFRRLVELLPDAVFVFNQDQVLFVNAAAVRLFGGRDAAQLLERQPLEFVPPEFRANVSERMRELLVGSGVVPLKENRGVRLDGTEFEFESSAVRVSWQGMPAIEAILRDITERKRAERALRASELRFQRLSESGLFGIVTSDFGGRIYEANDEFLKIIGCTREDFDAGINWWNITPTEFHSQEAVQLEYLREHGVCEPYEKDYIRKDGSRVHVLLGIIAMYDRDLGMAFVLDISRRNEAEQLRAGQSRVLGLMATGASLEEILTALIETVEQQCSNMTAAILLLDEEGKRFYETLAPSLPVIFPPFGDGSVAGPQPFLFEGAAFARVPLVSKCKKSDLALLPLYQRTRSSGFQECCSQPIVSNDNRDLGALTLYSRTCRQLDTNERGVVESAAHLAGLAIGRHWAEKALHRAKEIAEAANHSKDQFLAVLSHELRTPLTPALAAATMLEQSTGFPAELQDEIHVIRRSIELEARLIDDLLDLTRISRGKLELHLQEIDISSVLDEAVQVCSGDLDAKNLQLLWEVPPNIGRVRADATRLQQVYWNLLKNAIKFTPEGGSITVRCRAGSNGHLITEVVDTGIGIGQEVLPHIFNVFEQGGRTTTRQFGGLGIGLAICKAIVDLHGGTVSALSPGLGLGATFRVDLPSLAADGKVESLPPLSDYSPSQRLASAASKPKILLVEDHPDTAKIVSRILSSHGHEVLVAGTIAAAVELAERELFDVLVSDLGLPDGSGRDLMARFRSEGRQVRGIALSGYGMEEDMRRSLEAGFSEHLVKPVDIRELEAAIDRLTR